MEAPALKAAVELTAMPARARMMRDAPLPSGIPLLLRIAAGDSEAAREAAALTERPSQTIREAATFYIEQMLLYPEADSYRVLGSSPTATTSELRQNMALLIRWLHPDSSPDETRGIFVNRVNRAWDDLKTPERRTAYDRALASKPRKSGPPSSSSRSSRRGIPSAGRKTGRQTYQLRDLTAADLMVPLKSGRWSFFRRALDLLRGPKR